MPEAQAEQHVASLDVLVDGAKLDPKWRDLTLEVRVVDSLTLPDMALVRLSDPQGAEIDNNPLQLGKRLEVKVGGKGERVTSSIFKGQIAAVEPEFTANGGCVISVRAYDQAHKLNRERKTRTFQNVSASDMVNKIAGEAGLSADVTSTSVVHEFFQQSNETDWDFAWRLALMHDYEVVVTDTTLNFRPANEAQGAAVSLTWQDNLMSFRPRMTGVQQPTTVNIRTWDPKAKRPITGNASNGTTTSQAGVQRSQVANSLNGGTTAIADRVATTAAEANALASSTLNRLSDAFYEADGLAYGNPGIKAGGKVEIKGVGSKFGGTFTVANSTHIYRGTTGYQTAFQISGRSSRTLLELMRPPKERDWSASLVVGLVTNNNDPDQLGRVRVKYPSLSDSEESAWARIATPSSGNARGLLMLPQVDEEVIVGFEHGDTRRPIVVGSLFNGKDKPGTDLLQSRDGSFALLSNEKIHQHAKKDIEISSDQNMVIEITQDEKHTVKGNYTHEATGNGNLKAQQYTIEAGSTLTIKGASISVEAQASLTLKGATVDIQGSGPVSIKGAIINIG